MDSTNNNNSSAIILSVKHIKEEECLIQLHDLIKDDRSLDNFSCFFNDIFLLSFVRGKKHDPHDAYTTLVNYINVRRYKYRDLFVSLRPSTTASLDQGIIRKLKYRDRENRYVVVNRTWKWNPLEISADDTTKMFILLLDEAMQLKGVEEDGFIAIFDMTGYSFQHAKICTPSQVLTLVNLLWKNVPIRYKALHIVNEMFLISMLLKSVKPFLPKKLRERLHVHSNKLESLHHYVAPEVLPKSLGGDLNESEAFDEEFENIIRNKEEYYEKFAQKL